MNIISHSQRIYHSSNCNICYEEFVKNKPNKCILTKCGHLFDQECFQKWVNTSSKNLNRSLQKYTICPICKEKLAILKSTTHSDSFANFVNTTLTIAIITSIYLYKTMDDKNEYNSEIQRFIKTFLTISVCYLGYLIITSQKQNYTSINYYTEST